MPIGSIEAVINDHDVISPLIGSLVAGMLIGAEREWQGKPAGLRTHALVCFASALLTIVGLRMGEWTAALPGSMQMISDMSRMPHAILTGVGFLGAGVIFREGASVQGLTTAASLWLTAALGIVFGTGMTELAVVGTGIALAVLIALRVLLFITPAEPVLRIAFTQKLGKGFDLAGLKPLLARYSLIPGPVSLEYDESTGARSYQLLARGKAIVSGDEALLADLQALTGAEHIILSPIEHDLWPKR